MHRILVTGSESFLAKNLLNYFNDGDIYDVYATNHKTLDVSNFNELKSYLDTVRPHFIIHTAFKGGRRNETDTVYDFDENIKMIENLSKLNSYYRYLINFDSGASFNREFNIENRKELDYQIVPTKNWYDKAKFLNNLELLKYKNIINLRVFNLFGRGMSDSFIPTAIDNYINKQPIKIWEDKFYDCFYVEDLVKIIKYFIENPPLDYYELNCVYKEKYKLSDIANIINNLNDYKVPIIIDKVSDKNYTGNCDKLNDLGLKLISLEQGIKKIYNKTNGYTNT